VASEGVDDLGQRDLHIAESLHGWEMQAEGFGTTTDAGNLLLALVIALVEVTELLAAKGGRAAKDAISLAMAAGGIGHKTSKKSVVSCQLPVQDNGQQS
jgi:hypothetical protein